MTQIQTDDSFQFSSERGIEAQISTFQDQNNNQIFLQFNIKQRPANVLYLNSIKGLHTHNACVCLREPTLLDHLRASSCSCLAATIMGSLSTSPAFCSGKSSSFSSGGGGRGGGTSPSGKGGFGGACSSLTWKTNGDQQRLSVEIRFSKQRSFKRNPTFLVHYVRGINRIDLTSGLWH